MKRLNMLMLVFIGSLLFSVSVFGEAFIISVQTDNNGTSANNEFTIPVRTYLTYDYSVDCEHPSGVNTTTNEDGNYTCTYALAGNYQIAISGDFPAIFFNNEGDKEKIITVEKWGTQAWKTMYRAFAGASNLVYIGADDAPNLLYVTNMNGMFTSTPSLEFGDISNWNVSNVTSMNSVFIDAEKFNLDISTWNVSKVTGMFNMFNGCSKFNQDISDWDVSSVETMSQMFLGASAFNQDISAWDVSSVTGMANMLRRAEAFNQNISDWNVSSVGSMMYMFTNAYSFNQDIGDWNTSLVQNMEHMFENAQSFNKNIGNWDVSSVKSMTSMFKGAKVFNQDIGDWDVSSVTDMNSTFSGAIIFNQDIGDWDISSVTGMKYIFTDVHLSVGHYDSLLLSWNNLALQSSVVFDATSSRYCKGLFAKPNIVDNYNWIISDAGAYCYFYISSPNIMRVDGEELEVGTVSVYGNDGSTLIHTILDGGDGNKFSIDSNGVLRFLSLPDIENPTDKNEDNIYRVRIKVDNGSIFDIQTIRVKVESNSVIVPIINYLLN